ncbi:short-chain dehydrogenase [Stenotrophomonas maltophilia]|nr:short-chain dehydrogenase [Stenotrophomonas maltophilia]MBA0245249.1 SDR family oxidoreductase [Stenotrophomonas maltophilia]MBA0248712.1 SDR family oxidoreductase [Stenotrophomonas maltophilia]MBA0308465.1 SDR family oxidoreductase [Stenotrophomonas maltophilia]MBA0440884.1 SDR family oxidoreductase [Stenotrophomonas maltophilia]
MNLQGKVAVVTGGSRGLGLGIVEALVAKGAVVTVAARGQRDLEALADRLGVTVVLADVTDQRAAQRIVEDVRPDVLVLNAGVSPKMGRLDDLSWEDFSLAWETDVQAGLYWLQASLKTPLPPGSRVFVASSGAAESGSQRSGGYGGAKRMLWLMAKYANLISKDEGLGIVYQALVPRSMTLGTGVGDAAADAYSGSMNISAEEFVSRFGAPMSPRQYGDYVVALLEEARYEDALAFGINGESGVVVLE